MVNLLFDDFVDKPLPEKQKTIPISVESKKCQIINPYEYFTKKLRDITDPEIQEQLKKNNKRRRTLAWYYKMYYGNEEYRQKHIADSTLYYEENKPIILAKMKKKYDEDPEHYRELSRKNRVKHRDEINAKQREKYNRIKDLK